MFVSNTAFPPVLDRFPERLSHDDSRHRFMSHVFDEYGPVKSGDLGERRNGAIISQDDGNAVAYALWKIQERGRLFIGPENLFMKAW